MRIDEAFAELGVAPGTSSEEVRRAYLRLVKTRSPEIDPEGFARLRSAYEMARRVRVYMRPDPPIFGAPVAAETDPPSQAESPAPPVVIRSEATQRAIAPGTDPRIAAPLLCAELDAAAREMRPPSTPIPRIVRIALELYADAAWSSARQLTEALERHAQEQGGELRVFMACQIQWMVASEIRVVGSSMPKDVRIAIASELLDATDAENLCDTFDDLEPEEQAEVRLVLAKGATPALASLLGPVLQRRRGSAPATIYPDKNRNRLVASIAIVMALGLVQWMAETFHSVSQPRDPGTRLLTQPAPEPTAQGSIRLTRPRSVSDAVAAGDCGAARRILEKFEQHDRTSAKHSALVASYEKVCGVRP